MTARDPQPIVDALIPIIGDQHLLTEPAACAAYAVQGVAPGCVAAPANIEELAGVLRVAQTLRAVVAPWGGGTQQLIGNPPEQVDVVIRTERLNRVLIHEPFGLTISVEGRVALGGLSRHL